MQNKVLNRTERITIRFTQEEKQLISEMATISGKRTTDFVRDIILKRVKSLEKKQGRLIL